MGGGRDATTSPSPLPTQNQQVSDYACKVPTCKYVGSKNKDLQSHVKRMHQSIPKAPTPTPPSIPSTPPPGGLGDQANNSLFSNMAKSWTKKKQTPANSSSSKVKKELLDGGKGESLHEQSDVNTSESVNSSFSDVSDNSSMSGDEASYTSSAVDSSLDGNFHL